MKLRTSLTAAMALSAAGLAPLGAQAAGYGITATSTAVAGNVYSNGSGSCRYDSAGGVCNTHVGYYGGSSAATVSPTGGAGTATKVTASTSASGAGATATSRLTADLATASLHLYGADSGQTANVSSQGAPFGYTLEDASMHDTLHFAVLGASASTVTTVTAIFTLEGSLVPGSGDIDMPNTSAGELYGALTFANVPSRFDLKNNASTGFMTTAGLDNYPSGLPNTWTTNANHTINVSTFTFNIIGAASDFNFNLDAHLQCDTGFTCDFENTAKFALSLPSNVSFTSDSGVFLTGGSALPGGVPEPASWALMLCGFAGLGAALRSRRRVLAA